ncbi:hypothetical protein M3Y99_02002000 [Aphelenchoides fujianensis]|nr:hypothetical protein M3Y99_02002000 [Aphelenchoides fujianensis]
MLVDDGGEQPGVAEAGAHSAAQRTTACLFSLRNDKQVEPKDPDLGRHCGNLRPPRVFAGGRPCGENHLLERTAGRTVRTRRWAESGKRAAS